MKRQRSRNRSPGNGGKPQHNANRAFESNGPDGVKIRGAAQHVFEKYQQLARDALTAGDRVLGESYQQHAEHYFRVLRAVQPNRPASDIIGRDAFASGYDIVCEDERGEPHTTAETVEAENDRVEGRAEWRPDSRYREDRPNDRSNERPNDRQYGNRQRDDRPRDDNRARDDRNRDRNGGRDDRPRDDRPRDERPRDDRPREDRQRDDRPRDDRPRDERSRDERPRNDRPRDDRRFERPERVSDPMAVVEPQASPLTPDSASTSSPMLRSQDGGVSQAPAFLQPRAENRPEAGEDGETQRPRARRRRTPRSFDGRTGEGSESVEASEDA